MSWSTLPTYERAFNTIADLICIVNTDSRVVMANSAMIRVTGIRAGDDCPTKDILCNCNKNCDILDKCINDKIEINRNGRIYLVSMTPIREPDGEYNYLLQSWRDITGEVHLKSKLTSQNQGMKKDLDVARRLQNSMLLDQFPDMPNIMFDSLYNTCDLVGGDFYDVFKLSETKVAFYIADVSGHGVSAAMLTVFFAQAIRSIMLSSDEHILPNEVLNEVWHRFVTLGVDEYLYVTAWMGVLDSENHTLTYCNAGHISSPILSNGQNIEHLEVPGFPVCRWLESPEYNNMTVIFPDNGRLLLYTDGLSDAWRQRNNPDENMNSTPDSIAINHLLNDDFDSCINGIWSEVAKGVDESKLDDDVAVLLVGLE